jgi:hypothetical protein
VSEELLYCASHAGRETVLRCGKCERPFCASCLTHTPVGLRCRQCAQVRPSPIYDVGPGRLLVAAAAGLAAGILGGFVLFTFVGAFALWLSPVFGLAVGEAVSRAANRKRGPRLQLIALLAIVAGAILGKYGLLILAASLGPAGPPLGAAVEMIGRDIWLMLFVAVAVLVGLNRVR